MGLIASSRTCRDEEHRQRPVHFHVDGELSVSKTEKPKQSKDNDIRNFTAKLLHSRFLYQCNRVAVCTVFNREAVIQHSPGSRSAPWDAKHPYPAPRRSATLVRQAENTMRFSGQLIEKIQSRRDLLHAESGELKTQIVPLKAGQVLDELRTQYLKHPIAANRSILQHEGVWRTISEGPGGFRESNFRRYNFPTGVTEEASGVILLSYSPIRSKIPKSTNRSKRR